MLPTCCTILFHIFKYLFLGQFALPFCRNSLIRIRAQRSVGSPLTVQWTLIYYLFYRLLSYRLYCIMCKTFSTCYDQWGLSCKKTYDESECLKRDGHMYERP